MDPVRLRDLILEACLGLGLSAAGRGDGGCVLKFAVNSKGLVGMPARLRGGTNGTRSALGQRAQRCRSRTYTQSTASAWPARFLVPGFRGQPGGGGVPILVVLCGANARGA